MRRTRLGSGFQYRRPAGTAPHEQGGCPLCPALSGTPNLNTHLPPTPHFLRWLRLTRLLAHLLQGVGIVALIYPLINIRRRLDLKRCWSAKLLKILGIRVEISLNEIPSGSLLVANHISWLDIFVINATLPAAFIAKAEVRNWPLIGWLAARTDTIFLRRGSRGHARIVNGEVAAMLEAGRQVALFPEGTTTDGGSLLHFHAALLQPAIDTSCPIVPLALSYHDSAGQRSTAPAYVGDTSLWQSLKSILAARSLKGWIEAAPPLSTGDVADRKELAAEARRQIANWIIRSQDSSFTAEADIPGRNAAGPVSP